MIIVYKYPHGEKITKASFVSQRKDLARIGVGSERQANSH